MQNILIPGVQLKSRNRAHLAYACIHNDCLEHPSLLTGTFVVISTGLWFCSTNLCSAL